jgi:hypothetical protein
VNVGYIRGVGVDAGQVTRDMFLLKPSQKEKIKESINQSELSFETNFNDKSNTSTEYTLTVQLSTGHYEENLSDKDHKGKPFNTNSTGLCVKLHGWPDFCQFLREAAFTGCRSAKFRRQSTIMAAPLTSRLGIVRR